MYIKRKKKHQRTASNKTEKAIVYAIYSFLLKSNIPDYLIAFVVLSSIVQSTDAIYKRMKCKLNMHSKLRFDKACL